MAITDTETQPFPQMFIIKILTIPKYVNIELWKMLIQVLFLKKGCRNCYQATDHLAYYQIHQKSVKNEIKWYFDKILSKCQQKSRKNFSSQHFFVNVSDGWKIRAKGAVLGNFKWTFESFWPPPTQFTHRSITHV